MSYPHESAILEFIRPVQFFGDTGMLQNFGWQEGKVRIVLASIVPLRFRLEG